MTSLLAAIVLLQAPAKPAQTFTFGIRPKSGVVYRYRQLMEATPDAGTRENAKIIRDTVQRLKVVRKNKAGFEVHMDTESVKLQFPPEMKFDANKIPQVEAQMKAQLEIGATFDSAGKLKNFVTYTEEDHQKLWPEMASVCFAFVVTDYPGKRVGPGDTWTEPADMAAFAAGFKDNAGAIKPGKPLTTVWAVKAIEKRNGRDVAIVISSLIGSVEIQNDPKHPASVARIDMSSSGTQIFDVATGMLIESEIDVTTKAEGIKERPSSPATTITSRTKSKITLLNPGAL